MKIWTFVVWMDKAYDGVCLSEASRVSAADARQRCANAYAAVTGDDEHDGSFFENHTPDECLALFNDWVADQPHFEDEHEV